MITVQNYNTQITKVDFSKLPASLARVHNQLIGEENALSFYGDDADITRVVDMYLANLNKALPNNSAKEEKELPDGYSFIDLQTASLKISEWDIFEFDPIAGTLDEVKSKTGAENSITKRSNRLAVRDNSKDSPILPTNENSNNRKSGSSSVNKSTSSGRQNANGSSGKSTPKRKAKSKPAASSPKTVNSKASAKGDTQKKTSRKSSASARRTKATKAKAATPQKPVVKPVVHRKVKSPELTVVTRFLNLPKSTRSHKSIDLFYKQVSNGLKSNRYVDHKSLMTEIKSMLKRLLDAMKQAKTDKVDVSLNDNIKAKCEKVLKGATEKLRVSYLGGIEETPIVVVPDPQEVSSPQSPNRVATSLPTIDRAPTPSKSIETFKFKGDFGKFLGPIAIEPDSAVVAAFTADKGTGKTHALFQAMEDIASSGYTVLFGSYEEFITSSLFQQKKDKYLSPESQSRISAVDQRSVPTSEGFFAHAHNYDVIILDSAQELPGGVDIQHLRESYPGKLFIIIYHATTDGKFKGGTSPQHKADIIIVGEKHGDFRENYLHYGREGKNRYQPEQGLKYSIFNQKLITNE